MADIKRGKAAVVRETICHARELAEQAVELAAAFTEFSLGRLAFGDVVFEQVLRVAEFRGAFGYL